MLFYHKFLLLFWFAVLFFLQLHILQHVDGSPTSLFFATDHDQTQFMTETTQVEVKTERKIMSYQKHIKWEKLSSGVQYV